MFIANIAFARPRPEPEYRSFGALWYDKDTHHAAVLLKGFRAGQFMAKPFDGVEAPYLEGDIEVLIGLKNTQKEYMWVGWIWTCSDQRGPLYNGVFEIDPWPVMLLREIREDSPEIRGKRQGVMLNINLVDKDGFCMTVNAKE